MPATTGSAEPAESTVSTRLKVALARYGVAGLMAAAVIAHLLIAARSVGPMYLTDEVGYLAGAEAISRGETAWALCGSSYSAGWSIPLAPLWWLPLTPVGIYQVAAFLSAAMGAAVMWPASLLARRLGASPRAALAIAALVTLIPTRALMDNYVIAENPLTFALAWAAVLAFRVGDRGLLRDHVAFGAALGAAALMHSRAIPFVMVGIAWLVVRAVLKASTVRHALAGAVPAAALAIAAFGSQVAMGATIFAVDERLGDLLLERNLGDFGAAIIGQVFTQVVSWSLLSILGLLAVATHIRGLLRSERWSGVASAWTWIGLGFVVELAFIVFVVSGNADFDLRIDMPIYGRYMDPFIVPLAVIGATALWSRVHDRVVRWALSVSVLAVALYGAVLLPTISADDPWIPLATPGFLPFVSPHAGDHRPGLVIAMGVAVAGAVTLFLLRRRPALWLTLAVAVAAGTSLLTDALRLDPFEGDVRAQSMIATRLYEAEVSPEEASLSSSTLPCAERNKLQFELASSARIAGPDDAVGPVLAVGPSEWPAIEDAGFTRVLFTLWENSAVWARAAE